MQISVLGVSPNKRIVISQFSACYNIRHQNIAQYHIPVAVASIILFILTERVFLPMVLNDEWTLAMIAITLVQFVLYIITRDENEDQKVSYQ